MNSNIEMPKVIGKIDPILLDKLTNRKSIKLSTVQCDNCGYHCPHTTTITTTYKNGSKSFREVCDCCVDELFGDSEHDSIF